MNRKRTARIPKQSHESGAAMLIAIFALMLVSAIAIALVVSSGTDSSLAGNYRTAASAYYGARAGLEEARGRLLWKNRDYINIANAYPNLMSAAGVPTWGLTQVLYILNPAPGESVDPTGTNPANYPDTEYGQEFPWGLGGAAIQTSLQSVSPLGTLPGPSYKWVRINAVTEQALNLDVNGDGVLDRVAPLAYDPANLNSSNQPAPSLIVPGVPASPTAVQALEITALAVAPNGGHRLLQYVVAPLIISPDRLDQNFPAALTLDGNSVGFQTPGTSSYLINGLNGACPSAPPAAPVPVPAIGYINPGDYAAISAEVAPDIANYPGAPVSTSPTCTATTPSLTNLNLGANPILRQSWLTPAALDAVMQDIQNSADVVINGPATSAQIVSQAPTMSPSNPMTVVVNGNLRLNGRGFMGYGLLLVTGALSYDPDATWSGVVLVVGQGVFVSSGSGSGGITGAVFVAQTRDAAGNLLASMGPSCFGSVSGCGTLGSGHGHGFGSGYGSNPGYGINYSSSAVSSAQGPLTYKVLSFREIPLAN